MKSQEKKFSTLTFSIGKVADCGTSQWEYGIPYYVKVKILPYRHCQIR